MRRFKTARALSGIVGTAVLAAILTCLLPDHTYQRFQLLDGTIQQDARWIYERVHFDPTPIDVAFLGPSRVGAGINAPRLQEDLDAVGVSKHVANLSTPEEGRNLSLVFAEELFASKHPELVVIGVIEKPGRFGHPAFKYLAPARLLVDPGFLGNVDYVSDLFYLPFRQMKLFGAWLFPAWFGMPATFDPAAYKGTDRDSTATFVLPDGRVIDRDRTLTAEVLDKAVAARTNAEHPPILPRWLADEEFGAERHYLRALVALAQQHGARIAFVFIPYFHGPRAIQEADLYQQYGPILDAGFLADHPEWFSDYAHLNHVGAEQLTDWLAPRVEALLKTDTRQQTAGKNP